MFQHDIQIRVRYAETDQMGFVYYGNYATYFEVARVETFRHLGFSYRSMEENGVMMPVLEYHSKYIRPALYDDLLTIKTYLKELPTTRIKFEYEVFNESGVLLNLSETSLVFVNSSTKRPCQMPESFLNKLIPYFEKK
jgi:acyl-CoA thioester hydrolase